MMKLRALVEELSSSFRELDQLLFDEDISHALGDPCSTDEILNLEDFLGFSLPPSYREFLLLCDGWANFDGDANILAIEDFRSDWVANKIRNLGIVFYEDGEDPFAAGMVPIMLGEDCNNFLLIDPRTLKADGEMDFILYDFTEEQARFPDFLSFLEFYLASIRRLINEERNGRSD